MPDSIPEIRGFFQNWKPFATLAQDDPLRTMIFQFIEAKSPKDRQDILARTNLLYRLHRIYGELGILRDTENVKVGSFAQLFALVAADFAQAIKNQQQKPFLTMILEGFEFERAAAAPNQLAARQFLDYFWNMRAGDPPIKYGIYPNSLIFSAGGKTHDELAREFTQKGFGSGMPKGGGFIARREKLDFAYDTHSQFVKSGDQRQPALEAMKRWIRLTGGDDSKVKITYVERLG